MENSGIEDLNSNATRIGKYSCFRKLHQRLLRLRHCFGKHRVLERYYVAGMLFIIVAIYTWNYHNTNMTILGGHGFSDIIFKDLTTGNYVAMYYAFSGGEIFIQVPGALLIYIISSHKFLSIAVAISSILYMLTPLAGDLGTLIFLLIAQKLVAAPLQIAVLSMWKDWAPPSERNKFVIISFITWILFSPFDYILGILSNGMQREKEIFYILGVIGLVWSLLWFLTVSDTPEDNSQLLQNEQICLQNNEIPTVKGRPKLSEVPWKRIIASAPVFCLCLIFLKIGGSFAVLESKIFVYWYMSMDATGIDIKHNHFLLVFVITFAVVLSICALITDFLRRKYPRIPMLRKGLFCGAFIIHAIILFGVLVHSITAKVICLSLSYIFFAAPLSGFFTNALELSSKYVPIIVGFVETFYYLGRYLSQYYIENIFDLQKAYRGDQSYGEVLEFEIGFTMLVALIFLVWGSLEEQPWSLNTTSEQENCREQATPSAHPLQDEYELREAASQNT